MKPHLTMYASKELGAYGYEEKEWFLPHVRQEGCLAQLRARGLLERIAMREAAAATDAQLQRFHTAAYIADVMERCAHNEGSLDHGPTLARAHIEPAARHIVGAVLDATARILDGELGTVFIPIAGFHHAHEAEARMYCLYNDPVLALKMALERLEGNVAYIDIDIHQGDGVYEAFATEPRVRLVDIHEDPSTLFPHSPEEPGEGHFPGRAEDDGRGAARGSKRNIPLKPGTHDEEYLALWQEAEDFLERSAPRFIVFESGVDCLGGDPLSHQNLTLDAVAHVTQRIHALAQKYAEGRLLVLGGGGYSLENTSQGWATVAQTLLESAQTHNT